MKPLLNKRPFVDWRFCERSRIAPAMTRCSTSLWAIYVQRTGAARVSKPVGRDTIE